MALGWLGGDGDVPYGRATESDDDVVFSDSNVLRYTHILSGMVDFGHVRSIIS